MLIRVLPWWLLCCAAAGAAGLVLRLPTVWGERLSFWTYAIPWPLGWGLLHLPLLAFGAAVLGWATRRGRGAGGVVAAAALGLLAAAALSAWDPQFKRWEWHPWTLFLAVDGVLLLPFAAFAALAGGPARAPGAPRFAPLVALLLPLLPVAALQAWWTHQEAQPSVAMTSLDPNDPTIQRVLVVVERIPASLAEGCAVLARLAPEPYPDHSWPGGTRKMHRILELRLRSSLAGGGRVEEPPPLLRYEWRPEAPQAGECRDVTFTPPRH